MARIFAPIVPPSDPRECKPWLNRELRRISAALHQSQKGLSAVARGESPDGSGTPLVDLSGVFLLAGRIGNQVGAGGTLASGSLTLTSTSSPTKGFIYLGTTAPRVAFDETNCFLGVGTEAPAARVHSNTATAGTSTLGALGTPHFRGSIADVAVFSITPTPFTVSVTDMALVANGVGIQILDSANAGTGVRFGTSSTRSFFQVGRKNAAGTVLNPNLTIGGIGATFATNIAFASAQGFWTGADNGSTNESSGTPPQFGFGVNPGATTAWSGGWRGTVVSNAGSTTSAAFVGAISANSNNAIAIEVRKAFTNLISGTPTFGDKIITLDYASGPARGKVTFWNTDSSAAGSLTSFDQELAIIDPSDNLLFGFGRNTDTWAPDATSVVLRMGDSSVSGRGIIATRSNQAMGRFAVCTLLGLVTDQDAASMAPPDALFHVRGTVANSTIIGKLESTRSGQTGDMLQIVSAVSSTVNTVWNARNVMVTGRIKTAVLFTDDNATIASAKLLALSVAGITAGSTRTWSALDLSGNNVIVGDDPPSVAAGSLGKVDSAGNGADITTTNLSSTPPAGVYKIEALVTVTASDAGAGTLTLTIGWTDVGGATTDTSVTIPLTATGRFKLDIPIQVASGDITYALTGGGTYGAARYAVYIRVVALG